LKTELFWLLKIAEIGYYALLCFGIFNAYWYLVIEWDLRSAMIYIGLLGISYYLIAKKLKEWKITLKSEELKPNPDL
jgi:hypothetical protein